MNALFAPMVDRRRQQWMESIADAIRKLESEKAVKVEDLQHNEVFGDTVLQAIQIALRTSQREKREALSNAVLNAAVPAAPSQAAQQMFLAFVDDLTYWHIRIVKLFDDPVANTAALGKRWPELMAGGMAWPAGFRAWTSPSR